MAPTIALPYEHEARRRENPAAAAVEEKEILRKKNSELEKEVRKSREREESMRRELHKVWERLRVAEEAEERLCSQLGELEAEAVDQARAYQATIAALIDRLSKSQMLLDSSSSPVSP